jgi:hypothetical protein
MEVATRHIQLAIRAAGTDRHNGWLAVIQQLSRTMDAIARAKEERGQLVAATTLRRDGVAAMTRLETWLGTRVAQPTAAGGATPSAQPAAALSPAAQAAREASGHAATTRAPGAPEQAPGQAARVDRGPKSGRGRGPRRS